MTPTDLIHRLQGRAAMARGNAGAYRASGYHAEALLHEARAEAYSLAAQDAAEVAGDAAFCRTCAWRDGTWTPADGGLR